MTPSGNSGSIFSSMNSRDFRASRPQLVGQLVTISTMEKPLPSSWFWKALRMACLVLFTLAGVLQLVRTR